MIPKVIHYCWFGHNPLPSLALKCIKSWIKYLPDYEIKEWNEDNFDINIIPFVKEAYKVKKYAFVSDYARFWILYHYGGIYFDTDVEIIRSLDDILSKGAFMGCEVDALEERGPLVAPGLGIATCPQNEIYKEILDFYNTIHFINEDGSHNLQTVVEYTTNILKKHGLTQKEGIQNCDGIYIYPKDYFCPKSYHDLKIHKTKNTVTIHHFAASWHTKEENKRHRRQVFWKNHPQLHRIYRWCYLKPRYAAARIYHTLAK